MRSFPVDAAAVTSLDKVLHEPARLCIVACLSVVDEADFVFLQSQTGMTGGNLSSHVKKLQQARYISVRKEFHESKPRTSLKLTAHGRKALSKYLKAIRELLAALEGIK